MDIKERLAKLRAEMKKAGFKAYMIPSSDAHLSEYTPEHWKARRWISGFTGSAGTILVTETEAGLWTDSRYFLQGAEELEGSTIKLFKMGVPGVPTINDYLSKNLKSGDVVGFDGNCLSLEEAELMRKNLSTYGVTVDASKDLFTQEVWADRPAIPEGPFFVQEVKYAGASTKDKVKQLLDRLSKKGVNSCVVTMLCELAWLFNIRGRDVECNPVGVGYGFVSHKEVILFVNKKKINDEVAQHLRAEGVEVRSYDEIIPFLKGLSTDYKLLVDSKRITDALYQAIPSHCTKIEAVSQITMMKAVKNETELNGVRAAMHRDGVALTRFFMWLEKTLREGNTPTEVEISEKLTAFRAKDSLYFGDSFDTIAGYQGHGAIVHYKAEPKTAYQIKPEGVLLLDSGGQYLDGTTDITRTIALSEPSDDVMTDYTLVMKGHIGIATAQYPEGTRGSQLDIMARRHLWNRGLNFGHGTGHGVGCFLNVHEGPQNIRTEVNPTELEIGMITSNEPGLYRADKYGIRIENLIVTKLNEETEFGRFFGFETVTLCYFDNKLIKKDLLTADELKWYNDYQERVYQSLSPMLEVDEVKWLREKTLPL